ncbi:MAG: type II secretion system protein GspG [Planctomycetes bacterium]|nr:type II secretion system protein GspG [Planctomycetota bacterium]
MKILLLLASLPMLLLGACSHSQDVAVPPGAVPPGAVPGAPPGPAADSLQTARVTKAMSDALRIRDAARVFQLRNGRFPELSELVDSGDFTALPTDPWGNAYMLLTDDPTGELVVMSPGPDNVPDTEDDVRTGR